MCLIAATWRPFVSGHVTIPVVPPAGEGSHDYTCSPPCWRGVEAQAALLFTEPAHITTVRIWIKSHSNTAF